MALLCLKAGCEIGERSCEGRQTDTVVIQRTDTVTLVEVKVDTLISFVNRLYPVIVHDTVNVGDTIFVPMPYEHKIYSVPDTLDVWYSGVDPKIDSTRIYIKNTTEIHTIRIKDERLNFLAVDVGLQDAAVTYIRDFKIISAGISAGYTYNGQPTARAVVGYRF